MPRRARGDGSVYYRSDKDLWVSAVSDAEGKRRYFYAKTKTEAQAKAREATANASAGTLPQGDATVGMLLYGWLAAVKNTVRSSTWVAYEVHVRLHLRPLHGIRASRLTPAHIRSLQDDLLKNGLAPRSVRHTNTVLRMALRLAVSDGVLRENVALKAKPPRAPQASMSALDGSELARLLHATEDPTRKALYAVCGGLGLRLGEALGLSWSDVDLEGRTLTVRNAVRPMPGQERGKRLQLVEPKTSQSRRTVRLPKFVTVALAGIPKSSVFVFTNTRGRFLDPRNTLRLFKKDLAAAGLPDIRLHDLRHTAATIMLANGTDLMTVSKTLGHSNIQTTSGYLHIMPSMLEAAADRMDTALGG